MDKYIDASGAKIGFLCQLLEVDASTLYLYRSKRLPTPYDFCVKFATLMQSRFGVECNAEELAAEMHAQYARPPHRPRSPQLGEPAPLVAVGAPEFTDLGPLVEVPVYRYIAAGPLTDEALVEEDETMTVTAADAGLQFLLVSGRSMEPDIEHGDTLKVDRHRVARDGDTGIVQIDEGSTVGILRFKGRKLVKVEKSAPGFRDIVIKAGMTATVMGVVVEIIKRRKPARPRS